MGEAYRSLDVSALTGDGVPFGILRWRKRLERQRELYELRHHGVGVLRTCIPHMGILKASLEAEVGEPVDVWCLGRLTATARELECTLCEQEWKS